MEGWLDPASRPRRNNNPGDIESGRFAIAHGAKGSDGRFAVFPTPELGFQAMRALFQAPAYAGLSVSAAIARYAPATENDTAHYISMVCESPTGGRKRRAQSHRTHIYGQRSHHSRIA